MQEHDGIHHFLIKSRRQLFMTLPDDESKRGCRAYVRIRQLESLGLFILNVSKMEAKCK